VANFKLEACQACGICAAECPALAIDIKLNEDTNIMGKALQSLDGSFITVFTCQYSVPEISSPDYVATKNPEGVNQVSLLCNNRIDVAHILAAFEAGADGVLVAACPDEKCRHNKGIDWPGIRVERAKEVLESAGIGASRLELAKVAKGSAPDLTAAIDSFKEKIETLGPNPVKVATPIS
jgi:heterodisulfide reductase subunit A